MGDVVSLPAAFDAERRREFIADMARFAEGVLSEKQVRKKYRLEEAMWDRLGQDDNLVEAIEDEKIRRIRDGTSAREKAQIHFADAPDVLGGILKDERANPRHRIQSAQELRAVSAVGPEAAPAADRFIIQINLGADTLRFDKSIAVDPNDHDPHEQVKVIVDDQQPV